MADETQPKEPLVTVVYVGPLKRKFGVRIQNVKYSVDPRQSSKLELPKSQATALLSSAPDVWKEFTSPDMPPFPETTVVPMSKRLTAKDESKAEG